MNHSETRALLTLCQSYDGRKTIDDLVVSAWQKILEDVEATDANQAVIDYYSEHREIITIADIRVGAKRNASRRAGAATAQHHLPGCRKIVDEFGATHAAAITSGGLQAGPGLDAVHKVLADLAERHSIPKPEAEMTESERIHARALRRARAERRVVTTW